MSRFPDHRQLDTPQPVKCERDKQARARDLFKSALPSRFGHYIDMPLPPVMSELLDRLEDACERVSPKKN